MAKKLFKCLNPKCDAVQRGEFWAEKPVCPQCGIEANHPKFGRFVQRLVVVHFDPPSVVPGVGENVRACSPQTAIQATQGPNGIPNPYHGGSGLPKAVNCVECMATTVYADALAAEDDEDGDTTSAALQRVSEAAVAAA